MNVTIKTPEEQEKMRIAGRLAAEVLDMIGQYVVPGVTTEELDQRCHDHIVEVQRSVPANLNYRGFPKTICTSVNHVVCHGIPNEKRLKAGDFVNIDVTVIRDGFHGDTSRMYFVGKPAVQAQRLAETCFAAMWRGIEVVRPGAHLGDIGHAIQSYVEGHDYSVVREYCGHGIGKIYHEDPQVLHYGEPGHRHGAEGRHDLHHRADGERGQAPRAPAAGWLDGDHQGPLAVGAVGAHHPRDPGRLRRAHPRRGRPAALTMHTGDTALRDRRTRRPLPLERMAAAGAPARTAARAGRRPPPGANC